MAKTLAQIQKQIEQLEREAKVIREKEIKEVVARIHEAISHYGLTVEELFPAKRGRRAAAKPAAQSAKKTKSAVKPKYRDQAGNTWSGRGRQPRWLVAAIAEGKTAEDFLIDKA